MVRFSKKEENPRTVEKEVKIIDIKHDHQSVSNHGHEKTIRVERKLYNCSTFNRHYPSEVYTGFSMLALLHELYLKHFKPSKQCASKQLKNRLPIIQMLKSYKIRKYLSGDVIAGITVNYSLVDSSA